LSGVVVTYPIGDGSSDGGFSQRGHTRELTTCFGRLGHDCYLEKSVGAVWDIGYLLLEVSFGLKAVLTYPGVSCNKIIKHIF
jgi:hypothetical protein